MEWFPGAKLNITENCLDRHLESLGDKPAIIWEANEPSEASRTLSYKELAEAVNRFAHVLRNSGVRRGDRVCIYMGMVPELAIALLACARIGAVHSVIFGGFSAQSISDRVQDAGAEYIVTADGGFRGNKTIPLKQIVDDALQSCPDVKRVIVLRRTGMPVSMTEGRDVWWADEEGCVTEKDFPAEVMDAEDPPFHSLYLRVHGEAKRCGPHMRWLHDLEHLHICQCLPGEAG